MFAKPSFVPQEMKTMSVLVRSYENRVLRGKILNPFFPNGSCTFESLAELLLTVDSALDDISVPEPEFQPRSFSNAKRPIAPTACPDFHPLATLNIKILFRRGASWQGEVAWVDRSLSSEFRSVLELVRLIDSILSPSASN